MSLAHIKNQLIQAYTQENLNEITTRIIAFNKQKNHHALRSLGKIVNDFTPFDVQNEQKLFARLIMLYHPDKLKEYQQTILGAQQAQTLQEMMHIVSVSESLPQLEQTEGRAGLMDPEDFEKEYGWNYAPSESDYYMADPEDETVDYLFDEENPEMNGFGEQAAPLPEGSFIAAVKQKIYGPMQVHFPFHLLEDMEEIEMADYGIEYLDGIEYCTYVKILDLSLNALFDIHKIQHCCYIQELYLSDNDIYNIDALANLQDLHNLDVANNRISDISALYHLPCLKFVNLLNNPVSQAQIDYLQGKGVVVVS